MKKFKVALGLLLFLSISFSSFAGPKAKEVSYITVTVIQGKNQTEIIVHRGGKSEVEDKSYTGDDHAKDINPDREREYNKVIDRLNELANEGYEVVQMSVTMAGSTNVHPYTVYLLKKTK